MVRAVSSIQGRLIGSLLCASALILLGAGLILNRAFERQFLDEFDHALRSKAETLAILVTQSKGEVEFDFADELMPAFEAERNPEYFELRFGTGVLLEKSRSLGSAELIGEARQEALPSQKYLQLPDGRAGRMTVIRFVPHMKDDISDKFPLLSSSVDPLTGQPLADIQIVLAIAKGTEALTALNDSLHRTLMLSSLGLLLAFGLITHWLVKINLQPLNIIANEVKQLDSDNLTDRIRTRKVSREVQPIVIRINELLERLERAFEREKRFSSNVAHELKTPIAEFRSLVEVAQTWRDDKELVERYFKRLLGVAQRMDATVSTLLLLARLESDQYEIEFEPLSVVDLINEAQHPFLQEFARRNVGLVVSCPDDLFIRSDADKFRIVLNNLVSNAIAYSTDQSTIRVSCTTHGQQVALQISNDCEGLTQEELALIFDRFWRHDESRTGARHAGLGLSLVKLVCELFHYDVYAEMSSPNRFAVTVQGIELSRADTKVEAR